MSFISTWMLPPPICSYDATFILEMLHYNQSNSRGEGNIDCHQKEYKWTKLFEVNMSNRANYSQSICVTTEGGGEKH